MHTKAVFRAAQALAEAGIAALRFNFRGVGTSTGSYGEGAGEREDARVALEWLADKYPGVPLIVAGFSFGSRFGLPVGVEDPRVVALVGMGLPVGIYDFGFLEDPGKPTLVIQGEHDEFGAGARIEARFGRGPAPITVEVIEGADHYFGEYADALKDTVRRFFEEGPGARAIEEAGQGKRPEREETK